MRGSDRMGRRVKRFSGPPRPRPHHRSRLQRTEPEGRLAGFGCGLGILCMMDRRRGLVRGGPLRNPHDVAALRTPSALAARIFFNLKWLAAVFASEADEHTDL